jgi:hypothetical protein
MNWLLVGAVVLFVLATTAIIKMFGSLLNPIYLTFAIEFLLRTIVGYVAYYYVFPFDVANPEFLDGALRLSMLYAVTYLGGVALRNMKLEQWIARVARASMMSSDERARSAGGTAAIVAALIGLASLAGLAILGGGGSLWLTSAREAYLSYRSGFGFLWSIFASSVPLSALLLVHLRRIDVDWRILALGTIYVVIGFFSGSKQTILAVVLGLLFYRHTYVRQLPTLRLAGIFAALGVTFFGLTVLQGSFESLFESLSYVDYMLMSSRYLELEGTLSDIRGSGLTSYLWSFVPRILAPNKPFEYGIVLINSHLFPGAAEVGYTPAYLEWTLLHLDFGAVGVALLGFVKGQVVSSVFRAFQANPENLFLFLFTCHLGFMIFNVPGVYELAMVVSLGVAWAIRKLAGFSVVI